ncbi:MAG: sugar ABC transporter permease [Alphaproteobacteria bacterium]|nr:sugar ABC transporter permease [Alphaproteobacteria bacterium]
MSNTPQMPRELSDRVLCGIFIMPTLGVLLLMVAYPFISLLYYSSLSFSVLRPLVPARDMGLLNYELLLTDPDLWQRFIFTGKFVFLTVTVQFILGITVAYYLQRDFRARDFIFTLFMLPMMLCPIVVGFLWRYMFNSEWGIVNVIIAAFGGTKLDWLGVADNAIIAVVIADAWMWTPFVILLATAAFRGIPKNLHEAASIDGVSAAYRFFRITLPLSMPILLIALLLRLIDAFKQYDLFFALTGGGPGAETMTVSFEVGKIAFKYFYTGQASALAVILLIIIVGLSMVFVRYLNNVGKEQ